MQIQLENRAESGRLCTKSGYSSLKTLTGLLSLVVYVLELLKDGFALFTILGGIEYGHHVFVPYQQLLEHFPVDPFDLI